MTVTEHDPVLPAGLSICTTCSEAKGVALVAQADGTLYTLESPCLCDGVTCRYCGRGRIRRPCRDFYSWRSGRWLHVAWFGYRARCEQCDAAVSSQ